jgi:hypothetical protein
MMRRVRQVVVTAALALVIAVGMPVLVHRHDFDVAFSHWKQNQTTDTFAALKTEMRKNWWVAMRTKIVMGGVVFLLLNGTWFLVRRLTRDPPLSR